MNPGNPESTAAEIAALRASLVELRNQLDSAERGAEPELAKVHPDYRASALNLIQYLATRQVDLRPFQLELWRRGLSSLGRIEGHVRDALDQVISRLDDTLARGGANAGDDRVARPSLLSSEGDLLLRRHTSALLGPEPAGRHVYVMATAPDAVEVNDEWMRGLIGAGVNVLRVNTAHESVREWEHVVRVARRISAERGVALRILVDLPGPKLRTVAPAPGPRVVRWKPQRDVFGRVTEPVHVALWAKGNCESPRREPYLDLPDELFARLNVGGELRLRDARGRKRRLIVTRCGEAPGEALLERTAYLVPETVIELRQAGSERRKFTKGVVEARPFELVLRAGERFRLRDLTEPAPSSEDLPVVGCSLHEPLLALSTGARVSFDDGKLACSVETREPGGVVLRVVRSGSRGFKLRADKGINLPDTRLPGPTLGPADEEALAFAISHADIVGASFVRDGDDVRALHARLEQLGAAQLGVIWKIETATAFAELPSVLLAAMTRFPTGVMIARGDLAVEAGFERLAELQEEILWLCEAAHLPAIWATQVLDQMARTGMATRAEVTDAAMAVRAECVMLNKGPFVTEAVTALIDILQRMEAHQYKKRSLYRKLHFTLPGAVAPKA